jgi:hypothetical protein
MTPTRRYRCRLCGHVLHAWRPWAKEPDGALLLGHLAQQHPGEVGAYLARMHTDKDHVPVVLEAFEVVEAEEPCTKPPSPTRSDLLAQEG